MIKQIITYNDFDGNELKKEVCFFPGLNSYRQYKELTGREFFSDYANLAKNYSRLIQQGAKAESEEEKLNLSIEILTNPEMFTFLLNYIITFYAEYKDGRFIQNANLMDEVSNSLWLHEAMNFDLFSKIFQDLSRKSNLSGK